MTSEVVKNWAVTILCSVTALVVVAGYFRLEKTLTLVEARSDAIYTLMANTEQRNRTAFDATVKAGEQVNVLLSRINTDALPRFANLLTEVADATRELKTSGAATLASATELVQQADASVQRLTAETSLGVTQLNHSVGQTSQDLQLILQKTHERLDDPRLDHIADSGVAVAHELEQTARHLSDSAGHFESATHDLRTAAASAPEVAKSIDAMLRQQRKWSTWILIARLLSLAR